MNNYEYMMWPGAYSFKNEISLFLEYIKEEIDDIMKKIEETEDEKVSGAAFVPRPDEIL